MPRVIHFEVCVEDPERAKKFYRDVFGWKIEKGMFRDHWLITTGDKSEPGINGLMRKRSGQEPTANTILQMSVPSIDEIVKKIEENGGKMLISKFPFPSIGYSAYFRDTEGNIFGILQEDELAGILLQGSFPDAVGGPTLAEQLGYTEDSILVIVHADDIGMHRVQTDGALDSMNYGMCRTGSVMVPCPDFERVAEIWKKDPKLDLGIHLTLTSDFSNKEHGWSPILPKSEVPSLYNPEGLMWLLEGQLREEMNVKEALLEVEAQIQKVLEAGLEPTHIDDHSGSYFQHDDLAKGTVELSKKYNLPMNPPLHIYDAEKMRKMGYVFPDTFWAFQHHIPGEESNPEIRKETYHKWLRSLKPGVHEVVTHISFMTEEYERLLQPFGSARKHCRYGDYQVWTNRETKALADETGIAFIGYRELQRLQAQNWGLEPASKLHMTS